MTYRAEWVPEGTTRVSDLMKICIRVSTVTEGTTHTLETGGDPRVLVTWECCGARDSQDSPLVPL